MALVQWKALADKLKNILIDYSVELKEDKSSTKRLVFFVRAKDKDSAQKKIEEQLKVAGFAFARQQINAISGSTECTVIDWTTQAPDAKVVLAFKPASGGMSETTLNSTITELSPALAFTHGFKPKDVDHFYDFLKGVDHKTATVYVVDRDRDAGSNFIDQFPLSSKYKEKMTNAIGVLGYIHEEHKKKPIKNVYWGYRAKPPGVDSAHKGDIFLYYHDNKILGVSLKAGGEKTKEPKLNTYVNVIMESLATRTDIVNLRKKLFDVVYKQVGCTDPANYDISKRNDTYKLLANLEKTNLKRYEELYDTGLEIIRSTLCDFLKKDVKKTTDWVKSAIIGEGGDVPLIVIKAYNDKYQVITDDDDISVFLPKVIKVDAYQSKTSKQDFFVELKSKDQTLKLKFAVRTSKVGVQHKLGQFYNLRVLFTGIV